MIKKLSRTLPLFALFILTLYLGNNVSSAVSAGLGIAFTRVIPVLFPYFFLSSMLIYLAPGGSVSLFSFFVGNFCGFPTGAKYIASAYKEKKISKHYAENLLFSVNNAGIGCAVILCGKNVFSSQKIGYAIFAAQLIFSFISFILTPKEKSTDPLPQKYTSFGDAFVMSSESAVNSSLSVISVIAVFSFLEKIFFSVCGIGAGTLYFIISMLFEISGGFVAAKNIPFALSLPVCLFGLGFGGVSALVQSISAVRKAGLSVKKLILGKLVMGAEMALFGIFLSKIL